MFFIEKSFYQSCTRSEILRTGSLVSQPPLQDAKQLNLTNGAGDTLAPLDALKEISRKRIHCDVSISLPMIESFLMLFNASIQHIDGDQNKKQKPEATVVTATAINAAAATKRQRDAISPNTNK